MPGILCIVYKQRIQRVTKAWIYVEKIETGVNGVNDGVKWPVLSLAVRMLKYLAT